MQRRLQVYLGTEAIVQAEPDIHQRKGSGFIQEVSQKAADTVIRPVAMDQQQPAQEAKLCQSEVSVLYSLTVFYTTHTNPYVCHYVVKSRSCSHFLRPGHNTALTSQYYYFLNLLFLLLIL